MGLSLLVVAWVSISLWCACMFEQDTVWPLQHLGSSQLALISTELVMEWWTLLKILMKLVQHKGLNFLGIRLGALLSSVVRHWFLLRLGQVLVPLFSALQLASGLVSSLPWWSVIVASFDISYMCMTLLQCACFFAGCVLGDVAGPLIVSYSLYRSFDPEI